MAKSAGLGRESWKPQLKGVTRHVAGFAELGTVCTTAAGGAPLQAWQHPMHNTYNQLINK